MRRRTDWHRRLMFCGMAILTGPGLGRLLPMRSMATSRSAAATTAAPANRPANAPAGTAASATLTVDQNLNPPIVFKTFAERRMDRGIRAALAGMAVEKLDDALGGE